MTVVKQRTGSQMAIPVVLGDAHLQHAAKADDRIRFAECNAVDVGGHNRVRPKLNLATEGFKRKDVGDVADVFVVPEQDLLVTGDTEVVKLLDL